MIVRGGGSVGINERLSGSGRAILSSSSALEYAFELDQQRVTKEISRYPSQEESGGRPSVFTEALVRGLITGEADRNRDGRISIDELYDYTYSEVTAANPNQTPTKFSDVSGELIVAYSPGTARPPALPDEVSSAVGHPLASVRAAAVTTLKDLALAGDEVGRLAHERLKTLLNDDSRMVAAGAGEAIAEIDRAHPFQERERMTATPARPPNPPPGPPRTGGAWTPPAPPGPASMSPPSQPWPPRLSPVPPPAQAWEEPLRGGSVLAYLMPFFASLALLFSRSRNVRYHAVQCALIDVVTTFYFFVSVIPVGLYGQIRYGSEPVPGDDIPFIVWTVTFLLLPCVLRGYCLVQLARRGTARIRFLGTLARRVVYRPQFRPQGAIGTFQPPDRWS